MLSSLKYNHLKCAVTLTTFCVMNAKREMEQESQSLANTTEPWFSLASTTMNVALNRFYGDVIYFRTITIKLYSFASTSSTVANDSYLLILQKRRLDLEHALASFTHCGHKLFGCDSSKCKNVCNCRNRMRFFSVCLVAFSFFFFSITLTPSMHSSFLIGASFFMG